MQSPSEDGLTLFGGHSGCFVVSPWRMSMMTTRRRRSFSPEFKAQTVELVRTSGKSVTEVCRDLDLTETAMRRWVAQAEIDAG